MKKKTNTLILEHPSFVHITSFDDIALQWIMGWLNYWGEFQSKKYQNIISINKREVEYYTSDANKCLPSRQVSYMLQLENKKFIYNLN